jgi:hypothetical protein
LGLIGLTAKTPRTPSFQGRDFIKDIERIVTENSLKHEFITFRAECIELTHYYNTFCYLYHDEANSKLLSNTALDFFGVVNTVLHSYVLLGCCKLTDPADGKENLTIEYIEKKMKLQGLHNSEMSTFSDIIHESVIEIRSKIRNKVLAHHDRALLIENPFLPAFDKAEIFFTHLQKFTDEVGNALGIGPLDYQAQPCQGDAMELIKFIKQNRP